MQQMVDVRQLKDRTEALGLSIKELAREAGLNPSTPYRVLKTGNANHRTLVKLSEALERRERQQLAHLTALYPDAVAPAPLNAAA
jgi:predicted transcriptional regulator